MLPNRRHFLFAITKNILPIGFIEYIYIYLQYLKEQRNEYFFYSKKRIF